MFNEASMFSAVSCIKHTCSDIPTWFIKKPGQKFEKWMPNNAANHGWMAEKVLNMRFAQMV